jgi:hypothetical protein
MLQKSHISDIRIHSDEWYQGRLAKFTASDIHALMGEKPYQKEFMSYVYKKVGEELTGLPARDEIDSPATRHGLLYENEAIRKYGEQKGLEFVVTQKLITEPGSRHGCTPDFLEIVAEKLDKMAYEVVTGEVKCPLSYNAFIGLCMCKTPEDVYRESRPYFWQVCSQMDLCGALNGRLIIYHPEFRAGSLHIIEFRKTKLVPYFTLLVQRKKMAEEKFNEIREEMIKRG